MKNKLVFIRKLVVSLFIATILSTVVAVTIAFLLSILSIENNIVMTYTNTIASTLWGLIVGYAIHKLIQTDKTDLASTHES